jgi:hypothetical protein
VTDKVSYLGKPSRASAELVAFPHNHQRGTMVTGIHCSLAADLDFIGEAERGNHAAQ